jgi:hypothetical protein
VSLIDDELIDRLRVGLDELTHDIGAEPPGIEAMVGLTNEFPQPGRSQRRLMVLAAAATALLVAVAGVLILLRDHHDATVDIPDSSVTTVSPVVTSGVQRLAVLPVPPTPEGWELLEWGSVRVALPPDLSPFHVGNACEHSISEAAVRVTCGDRWVEIHSGLYNGATPVTIVNGLHVLASLGGDCEGCESDAVTDLDATVSVDVGDNTLAASILATVGPSGTWRFENEPRPAPPAAWQTVSFDQVTIRVPSDWAVETTPDDASSTCPHVLRDRVVQLDHGFAVDCAQVEGLRSPSDGVRLYSAEPPLPIPTGRAEQIVTTGNDGAPTVVLEVGFGADPAIGLAILNSLASQPPVDAPTSPSVTRTDKPVVALGESVMLGAAPLMEARGIRTYAEVSAGPNKEMEWLQAALQHYNITYGVVIQLGSNGTVTREQYESLLAEVPARVQRIVMLTVHADRPWIDGNNAIIRSLPATHPNVIVLDWDALAAGPQFVGHLSSDGVHLKDDAAKTTYTNSVLQALGLPT